MEPLDKTWDDVGIFPETMPRDLEFLVERMTDETLQTIDLKSGERVLDVGCGRGLDLLSLQTNSSALFGFDGSKVMINIARENFEDQGVPNRLALGSAEHLPYKQHSFDKVYCKGAIDHFYDPGLALSEMVRVLKPGGQLIVSLANYNNLGFRIGKLCHRLYTSVFGKELPAPHYWDKPDDHVYEFDHSFLLTLLPAGVRVNRYFGLSMLYHVPKWGRFLGILPERVARGILTVLDRVSRSFPVLADVVVVRAERIGD
jgi:SAM-dependent methyltransferase